VTAFLGQFVGADTFSTAATELAPSLNRRQARTRADKLMRSWRSAATGDDLVPAIPARVVEELTTRIAEIGMTVSDEQQIASELRAAVADSVNSWQASAPFLAVEPDSAITTEAQNLAADFASHADASEILTAPGYLGAAPSVYEPARQFFYLNESLQSWWLIRPSDILSLARVPDEKQPFGCKPDRIWLKSYTPVISGDARLSQQAIEEKIGSSDFTPAAAAVAALTRDMPASPGDTFGEEIIGQGFSRFHWCLTK